MRFGVKIISFVLRIIGTYCKCVISPSPTLTGDEYMNARRQIASIIAIATVAWPAVSPAEAPGQARMPQGAYGESGRDPTSRRRGFATLRL